MHNVWGRLPNGLRERPFDVLTAFLLVLLGVFEIVDPSWPEAYENDLNATILVIVSLYLMVAGFVILVAIFKDPKKYPVFSYFGQMFGWGFVAAATAITTIMYLYYAFLEDDEINNIYAFTAWLCIWMILTLVAFIRSFDMWMIFRRLSK